MEERKQLAKVKEENLKFNELKKKDTIRKKEAKELQKKIKKMKFVRKKTAPKKLPRTLQDENNIYDKAIELFLKDKFKLFEYQNYNPLFTTNLAESDSDNEQKKEKEIDERCKFTKQNFREFTYLEQKFLPISGWNESMYVPPAFKDSYQLSIWKIENFGVIKIIDKYFTPKIKRAVDFDFPGFVLELSLDEQTMLMVERDHEKQRELLAVSFDMYSLEILSEMLVSVVDESIRNEYYYQGKRSEQDMYYKGPFQIGDHVPKITSWNFGNYIIAGVSTSWRSRIMYRFRVYNAKTSSLITTIDRSTDEILENKIISISFDESREEILHWATIDNSDIVMLEININTGDSQVISKYSGFTPIYAFPTEDLSSVFLVHQDSRTKIHKLYCAKYQFSEDADQRSEYSDGVLKINRSNIEHIGELGVVINMIKLVGNKLIVISSFEGSRSVLTVYDNLQNMYLMKSEQIIRKGRRPEFKE